MDSLGCYPLHPFKLVQIFNEELAQSACPDSAVTIDNLRISTYKNNWAVIACPLRFKVYTVQRTKRSCSRRTGRSAHQPMTAHSG
jgi:hypothetical protein